MIVNWQSWSVEGCCPLLWKPLERFLLVHYRCADHACGALGALPLIRLADTRTAVMAEYVADETAQHQGTAKDDQFPFFDGFLLRHFVLQRAASPYIFLLLFFGCNRIDIDIDIVDCFRDPSSVAETGRKFAPDRIRRGLFTSGEGISHNRSSYH